MKAWTRLSRLVEGVALSLDPAARDALLCALQDAQREHQELVREEKHALRVTLRKRRATAAKDHRNQVKSQALKHEGRLEAIREQCEREKAAIVAAAEERCQQLQEALASLVGPGHLPPPGTQRIVSNVARPALAYYAWRSGPWTCLRLEERTIGHHESQPWINPKTKMPALRRNPETDKWMGWARGIAEELRLPPLEGQVRVAFYSGLAYTFIAWREVPFRDPALLHPMDPDNAVKATLDGLQAEPYRGETSPFGAYRNDTQVVDLLVFRLPQDGKAPVDRLTLSAETRRNRKVRRKIRAQQELEGP